VHWSGSNDVVELVPGESVMPQNDKDSPFLLVEHGKDGLWHVHASPYDTTGVTFKARQEACDYASQLARNRKDAMVLMREQQDRRRYVRS